MWPLEDQCNLETVGGPCTKVPIPSPPGDSEEWVPGVRRGVQIFPEMIASVVLSTHSLRKQMGHSQSLHA